MFTDELIEDLLINKKMNYSEAFPIVCAEKVAEEKTFTAVRRVENAYQLVVKRHPELNPAAFRMFVYGRSYKLAECLGWDKEIKKTK